MVVLISKTFTSSRHNVLKTSSKRKIDNRKNNNKKQQKKTKNHEGRKETNEDFKISSSNGDKIGKSIPVSFASTCRFHLFFKIAGRKAQSLKMKLESKLILKICLKQNMQKYHAVVYKV